MARMDFSEVAHTGGVVTFTVRRSADGQLSYQQGYSGSSPRPMSLCAVYAHPDGFACGNVQLGGIGQPWNPPPFPNCIAVFMASDSEGRFGHECPRCHRHFRSESIPSKFRLTCPYCGLRSHGYQFLTPPQRAYVQHYVATLLDALDTIPPDSERTFEINMDKVADSVPGEPRPDFYYTSTTQQSQFACAACNGFNDVRGRFAYCSQCGSRNNAANLTSALASVRQRINSRELAPAEAVKQSISEFDSAGRDYVAKLCARIPMTGKRRTQGQRILFHNVGAVNEFLKNAFDIDMLQGLTDKLDFIRMMFHRRHVYEHDGGVASARYVQESGDPEGREGVLIRESVENAHKLLGLLERMAKNLDDGFHEIFPPERFCIDIEVARRARMPSSGRSDTERP